MEHVHLLNPLWVLSFFDVWSLKLLWMHTILVHVHFQKMVMEWSKFEGWGLRSNPTRFCLTQSQPHPAWWGNFFYPIPTPWDPANPRPPRKILLLVNLPTTITIFLIKPVSLIKIYLKLQINLSHQIKLIFSKNWIILLKRLTKLSHKKQKTKQNKKFIIQNQWFNSI